MQTACQFVMAALCRFHVQEEFFVYLGGLWSFVTSDTGSSYGVLILSVGKADIRHGAKIYQLSWCLSDGSLMQSLVLKHSMCVSVALQ